MYSRKYACSGEQNVASPADTILGITGGTTWRPCVYMISIGSYATPADAAFEWNIQRSTAAGTNTSVTPSPLFGGDIASNTTAGENHTAEPTYTAGQILWRMPLNQRASHTIHFDPEGGLVVPATANNGLGIYANHASSTVVTTAMFHFAE